MKYRIVIIAPPGGTQFWRCFEDPARALKGALAGHDVSIGDKAICDGTNILLGWNHLGEASIDTIKPYDYIIWQLEQLDDHGGRGFKAPIEILKAATIWDYDHGNIKWLAERGIEAEYVPVGYHPDVRSLSDVDRDIDVLAYGSMTKRRADVLLAIHDRANLIYIGNDECLYGEDLAPYVARAKVVLNVHFGDSAIQEQVRIVPVMSQGVAVVSETSAHNRYGNGIVEADYDKLVETTLDLVANGYKEQGMRGYEAIKAMPMVVPCA